MYLEFELPQGVDGQLSAWANNALNHSLHEWSDRYQIPYNTKIVKYKKRITFDEDKFYNFFMLTWQAKTHHSFWTSYRLITDLNNKL
jgi:hypothetical protein